MGSKYQWLVYNNQKRFADLTGLAEKRKFTITRGDSDEINFTISIDKLLGLAKALNVNAQDIIQSAFSEIRVVRYGTVQSAGELMPWDAKVGSDRKINLMARGWFELMKYRRTSAAYANQTAAFMAADLFNTTLARPYGNQGNYSGLVLGATPSPDFTNFYAAKAYDNKTVYDAIQELSNENNGFDFEFTWDKNFNIYYPNIGDPRPDIVLSYPGNVQDIYYTVDPTKQFNSLFARGSGYGSSNSQNRASVFDVVSQQKYGLREDVRDYPDITDNTQLGNLANADLQIYKQPLIVHQVIIDGGGKTSAPQVGSFHIGDMVRLLVKNFQLYQDVNRYFTIDQIQVEINEKDQETVTLSMS